MPISKLEARELMNRGYEMGATIVNGLVQQRADGVWTVADQPVEAWLKELAGRTVVVVASEVIEGRGTVRTCRTCGTEYEGYECPRCREVHRRLRGR
jgi:hypothetical protein